MHTRTERRDDDASSANAVQAAKHEDSQRLGAPPEQSLARQRQYEIANSGPRMERERALAASIQRKAGDPAAMPNRTGLPDHLKTGIESLSGVSMDEVKVHYNSSQPAQLNAHAYAQGTDIHIAPGQEKHLPHEAWHVVQQKQGRVRPTMETADGVAINADAALENEADAMGEKAVQAKPAGNGLAPMLGIGTMNAAATAQLFKAKASEKNTLTATVTSKWKAAILEEGNGEDMIGEIVTKLIGYCKSYAQAVFFLEKLTYDEWLTEVENGTAATDLQARCLQTDAPVEEAEVDELGRARKAIKDAGHPLSSFSVQNIQTVKNIFESGSTSWAEAVQSVWEMLEKERVAQARAAAIALLVPAADALRTPAFTSNAICMAVWNSAMTHAGATGKFELSTAYSAADLLAAFNAWGGFQQAADAAGLDGFATHRIGNGTAQDKSNRPDIKSRRFTSQMNFSITWKGSEQMHHVGLAGTENAQYTG